MKRATFSLLISFLFVPVTVWSQSAAPAKVPTPPKNARWSIDFSRDDKKRREEIPDADVTAMEIRRKEYTLTGNTALVKETYADGFSREIYQSGHLQLLRPRGSRHIVVLDTTDQPMPEQLFSRVFPGFDWVSESYLVGTEAAFGQPCLHYKTASTPISAEAPEISREAWVSQETGLPVAFKTGPVTGKYTFLSPPSAKVELPADFLKFLTENVRTGPPPGQTSSLLKSSP